METRKSCPTDFEVLLQKIMAEDIEQNRGLPCPDKFADIIANIEMKRGRKRLKKMGKKILLTLLILSIMSTSLYMFFPGRVGEAGRRLFVTVTHLFTRDFGIMTATSQYPFFPDSDQKVVERIDQLKRKAPFDLKLPMYGPSGYKVTDIAWVHEADFFSMTLFFESSEHKFIFTQLMMPKKAARLLKEEGKEEGAEVCILGNNGLLVKHEDGNYNVSFFDENLVYYMLRGNLPKEEILRIARSLY